jgi:hypothetical protein
MIIARYNPATDRSISRCAESRHSHPGWVYLSHGTYSTSRSVKTSAAAPIDNQR